MRQFSPTAVRRYNTKFIYWDYIEDYTFPRTFYFKVKTV